ncbi:hypothetical protein GOTRE_007_00480 [Gordonia terrae NBRC 100016]|uniref:Uncharacterized protein n=1 Tax=Gordonia terrae NBRC 100016 TaxID=1089454 RepID=A0ABQ0H884_9ACTN|nr:hypothetical protein GOTRE_007_00480 [Gordonia terrae NBRC 100016]VTR07676.1 Uncharacterised protein [Clostridioides difficile]
MGWADAVEADPILAVIVCALLRPVDHPHGRFSVITVKVGAVAPFWCLGVIEPGIYAVVKG